MSSKSELSRITIEYCPHDHTPNAETIKAMQNAKNDKGLIRGKKAEDIAKKF